MKIFEFITKIFNPKSKEQNSNKITIFHVARYIIDKLGPIEVYKLHRLCYYCQAWYLAWSNESLFDEDFQAWANGPVCPELRNEHKDIFITNSNLLIDYKDYPFTKSQKSIIDTVLELYGDLEPYQLNDKLIHIEKPYSDSNYTAVITKESIRKYYRGRLLRYL